MDDVDPGFDVGEGVGGGEDGLALELLVEVAVGAAVQREGRAVHEAPQVVVLVKVRDPVLHLVRVKVGLHVRDLDVGLQGEQGTCPSAALSQLGLCPPIATPAQTRPGFAFENPTRAGGTEVLPWVCGVGEAQLAVLPLSCPSHHGIMECFGWEGP